MAFFDSFTDGRKITLNVEARVVPRAGAGRSRPVLPLSPQPKDDAVWRTCLRGPDQRVGIFDREQVAGAAAGG